MVGVSLVLLLSAQAGTYVSIRLASDTGFADFSMQQVGWKSS